MPLRISIAILCAAWTCGSLPTNGSEPPRVGAQVAYGPARLLGRMDDARISESSGLAASRKLPGYFWTHNDSGDKPRLFLLDGKGQTVGVFSVLDAKAIDWEDMCSFQLDGIDFLLIADTGSNSAKRRETKLYLIEEPSIHPRPDKILAGRLSVARTMRIQFERGPVDCESVAVDAVTGDVLLASKQLGSAVLYRCPLGGETTPDLLTARILGRVPISWATAMDVSTDGRRMIVTSYFKGFEYRREHDETWAQAISKQPVPIKLPKRRQGEAVCYGVATQPPYSLYLTSEGKGQPFWQIPAD